MRYKISLALVSLFFLFGSAQGYQDRYMDKSHTYKSDKPTLNEMRQKNCNNLEKLETDMNKDEVLEIMGDKAIDCVAGFEEKKIDNPYKKESIKSGERQLEILYYYTHVKHKDRKITDDELTPLVFEDEKLIGWGWDFYEKNVKKHPL